jgi:ATP adenylyltransferase
MQRLFSPWRSKYIESFSQPEKKGAKCVLCVAHREEKDDDRLIVFRGPTCYVIMNLFPYNSGHLMIVPYRHVDSLTGLTDAESSELISLVNRMTLALQKVSHPDGFNIGANVGRAAGAGIDQHVHMHLVPRWNGDTNFLPVLSDTKMISEDMHATLLKLRVALKGKTLRGRLKK